MTQAEPATPPPDEPAIAAKPVTLTYFGAATGEVSASEAAIRALRKSRSWALFCAIGMFIYAVVGGFLGLMWLGAVIFGNPGNLLQFVIIIPPNLIGAPLALTGGILAIRYYRAVTRALTRRNPEDLERTLVMQLWIWRWAAVTVVALFALPPLILAIGYFSGVAK